MAAHLTTQIIAIGSDAFTEFEKPSNLQEKPTEKLSDWKTQKGRTMPAALMLHEEDPRSEILNKVGDLKDVEVFGSDVLVALYLRPQKTKSGIILADATRDEDKWQGKAGLIVKLGPTAYVDEDGNKFRDIKEGDWVVFRPSDGWPVTLNTANSVTSKDAVSCRIVTDIHIRMRISAPDVIY